MDHKGSAPEQEEVAPIDFEALLGQLLSGGKIIVYTTFLTTLFALLLAFVLPEKFTSTAKILPGSQKSSGSGNLSQLAALAGVNIGGASDILDAELYPAIIMSESVLESVIKSRYWSTNFRDSVNLIRYYEIEEDSEEKNLETALKTVRELLSVSMDRKTNLLTIELTTKEPDLSASIVNELVREVDLFIKTKRQSSAGYQRRFVEKRLEEVARDLKNSEEELKRFREKNRAVASSPELSLTQDRLQREVALNNTLFLELKKQFEVSKIEEVKDTPIITVVDSARAAAFKSAPKRRNMVLGGFFLGLFGAITFVLVSHRILGPLRELYRKHINRPIETTSI